MATRVELLMIVCLRIRLCNCSSYLSVETMNSSSYIMTPLTVIYMSELNNSLFQDRLEQLQLLVTELSFSIVILITNGKIMLSHGKVDWMTTALSSIFL